MAGSTGPDEWDDKYAARHGGTLNVLYADGHVESQIPSDVDPVSDYIRKRMWQPTYGFVAPFYGPCPIGRARSVPGLRAEYRHGLHVYEG